MGFDVWPVLQLYAIPSVPVSVVEFPIQILLVPIMLGVGSGLIVTELMKLTIGQAPEAGMVLVIEYVPGKLIAMFISPVEEFTKAIPAGLDEKEPALAPGGNVGNGLLAF